MVTRYFAYDAMNRQTLVDGKTAQGAIDKDQGRVITYDKNGNRLTDMSGGTKVSLSGGTYTGTAAVVTQTYHYDLLNRLDSVQQDGVEIERRYYDGASRLVQSGPAGTAAGSILPAGYAAALNGGSEGSDVRQNRYDANGRLLTQRVLASNNASLLWCNPKVNFS